MPSGSIKQVCTPVRWTAAHFVEVNALRVVIFVQDQRDFELVCLQQLAQSADNGNIVPLKGAV